MKLTNEDIENIFKLLDKINTLENEITVPSIKFLIDIAILNKGEDK